MVDRSRTVVPEVEDRYLGCILAGAVGDALGGGVEFMGLEEIRRIAAGPGGLVTEYVPAYGRRGAITDDTQMTLFTLEGLVMASLRGRGKGIAHGPTMFAQSYASWLLTQQRGPTQPDRSRLLDWPELHSRRAPGGTCLSALGSRTMGTPADPINDSKGCGAVMRAAPLGFWQHWTPEVRFDMGARSGAITHGHPSGYLPAGVLACAVGELLHGATLAEALDTATSALVTWDRHEETLEALEAGRSLGAQGLPSPEAIERLGGGWVGEEALAIAVACAIGSGGDLESGLASAVTHSGDSDSTGAICGNLLGALGGTSAIPGRWLNELELRDRMTAYVADCAIELGPDAPADAWGAPPPQWAARFTSEPSTPWSPPSP